MSQITLRAAATTAAAFVLLGGIWFWWSGGPPEIGQRAYEFTTALHSACNQKDDAKVDKLVAMIDSAAADGEISRQEAGALGQIVSLAHSERWGDAEASARKLMDAQVE
jgi:uncharacterized membrane protein YebE (DUF533 family)